MSFGFNDADFAIRRLEAERRERERERIEYEQAAFDEIIGNPHKNGANPL